MKSIKAFFLTAAMMATLFATTTAAAAQGGCDWKPRRAVTVIVPWGVGGGTDANARRLASLLQQALGVPFNVVNRTGGNGVVGHTAIARARPDGYTIGAATIEMATMHHIGLTPLTPKDLTPIALIDRDGAAVIVAKNAPWNSLQALLKEARQHPGKLTASGTAEGGIWQLALAGMLKAQGMSPNAIRWVPSQGAAPALRELMAGSIDVATTSLSEAQSFVKQGEVKALAYMSNHPDPQLPNVPLTAKILKSGWTMSSFVTISGPKNLPENIVCSYAKAIKKATQTKAWAKFKASRGTAVVFEGPKQTAATFQKADTELGQVIKSLGIGH